MLYTKEEAELIVTQLQCRKDFFLEEMKKGVKSQERLNQLNFIMNTLDKAILEYINII